MSGCRGLSPFPAWGLSPFAAHSLRGDLRHDYLHLQVRAHGDRAAHVLEVKLVAALQAEGLRSAVRDWLIEVDLEDLYLAAQNFYEDYPAFTAALDAAKSRFHLTAAKIPTVRIGGSGDYGADLLAETPTGPAVIQCKFHTHPVGYDAVQQAYTAKALYKATAAYVVTNATHTPQARRARL